MLASLSPPSPQWGTPLPTESSDLANLKAVVPICGIYSFTALRDAHPEVREVYETFTSAAFGPEEEGGWGRGDLIGFFGGGGGVRVGVEVVLGGSRGDEAVEWGQVGGLVAVMGEGAVGVVQCEGGHEEVVDGGVMVPRCVGVAVGRLRGLGGGDCSVG